MKRKIYLRILLGIIAFVLLVTLLTKVVIEPWIRGKIQSAFNGKSGDYLIKIEKAHVLFFQSGIELKSITLLSKLGNKAQSSLAGEIESVNIKGIHLLKALFRKDIDIREVDIFNCKLTGKFAIPKKAKPVDLSPLNIKVEKLFFYKLTVDVKSTTTAQTYWVKNCVLKLFEINIEKQDTLLPHSFGDLDFEATELKTVTPDSLYTILAHGINYSATSKILTASKFIVNPNYDEYKFTSRNKFQTNRVKANLSGITFHDFPAAEYIKSGSIKSSYIEIGDLQLQVFKDKRKEFKHLNRPTFQDMIYNYPGAVNIDTIRILNGNIVYTEHAEKAIEKGSISFNKINAHIYKITNDTVYKTKKAYLELNVNALLMGKSKVDISLKARIFDNQNTFAVHGTISGMEASELNPILEKIASISISSGKINALNFNFLANNTKATGNMKLLYHKLNFAVMNKQTGDTTAFKERVKSLIANIVVIESNPMPGKAVRPGIIEFERDPERYVFGYLFRSILSGIKTSITKNPKK